MRSGQTHRIPALDGWRGIAILLVLFSHVPGWSGFTHNPFAPSGHHGVAIFFVLSGFLITSKTKAGLEEEGSSHLKRFYIRRIFRLWPCAWIYLTFVSLVGITQKAEVVSCLLFYRNLHIAYSHPFTEHFWSLSVEEQFYLTWPFLLLLGRRVVWIAGIVIACLLPIYPSFFGWPFACLLMGCVAAFVPLNLAVRIPPPLRWITLSASLLVIAWNALASRIPYPADWIAIAFAIWITASARVPAATGALEFKPLAWLGVISYSVYLWQQVIALYPLGHVWYAIPWKIAIILAIASFSYYCLERPMIRLGHLLASACTARPNLVTSSGR